ncbi:integrase catalytic domain-containing protein [Nephila pilipes]|uniref:Integrase catalytic domain-containing protein n=1 Tax=Nephila pilipes TaxID=299642 RepID=A0A8X6TC10_NEPPI|nr:integrase catalytic domain-containing protein [Nephila pilipes]
MNWKAFRVQLQTKDEPLQFIDRFQWLNSSLVAIETIFEWLLQGRCGELIVSILVNFILKKKESVSAEIRRSGELEGLGIRDDKVDTEYRDVVDGYLEEGAVQRCMTAELVDGSSFYVPHHAVVQEDKVSSLLRIVFDGAAHDEGQYH